MLRLFNTKKSIEQTGILTGFVDRHTHLLPAVDDGFPTTEKSLEAIARMEQAGVAEVWFTPHIMEDYPNTTDALRSRFDDLGNAYTGKVQLRLAAEYMIDSLFLERWGKRDLLTMGEKNVLVETRCLFPPMEMEGVLGEMLNAGYHPILAHPERYSYYNHDRYRHLHDSGVLFQANVLSFTGYYGSRAYATAMWMLQNDLIDFLGSDIHNENHARLLAEFTSTKEYKKIEAKLKDRLLNDTAFI